MKLLDLVTMPFRRPVLEHFTSLIELVVDSQGSFKRKSSESTERPVPIGTPKLLRIDGRFFECLEREGYMRDVSAGAPVGANAFVLGN